MATQAKKVIVIEVQADGAEDTVKKIQEAFEQTEEQAKKTEEALNNTGKAAGKTAEEVGKIKKQNLGTFTTEIGNLTDKFKSGEVGVKGLASGVLQAGKAFVTAFLTNPIGIVIIAITTAVLALYNLFKSFKPVVDKIEQAFAVLSAIFKVLKSTTIDLLTGNKSLKESFVGLGSSMADAAEEAYNLKKAEQELEDSALALNVANAEAQTQIQQLILQSKDRTKTEEERIKLIDEALEIEKNQHEQNIKFADEEERIALRKMLMGQRLSEQEIENIRKGGIEALRDLQNKKDIADEDIENYANLLIKKQQLLQGSIAIQEKSENQKAALEEKRAADAQAAVEKAAAAAEKRAAEKAKREEEAAKKEEERAAQKKEIDDAIEQADMNAYEREKEKAQLLLDLTDFEGKRREEALKQLGVDKETYNVKINNEHILLRATMDRYKAQDELNKKNYESDKAIQIAILDDINTTTTARIAADDALAALDVKYAADTLKLKQEKLKTVAEYNQKILDNEKKTKLEYYDLMLSQNNLELQTETTKRNKLEEIAQSIRDNAKAAWENDLISFGEYTTTVRDSFANLEAAKKKSNERILNDAKQAIDTLAAIDKEATQTAINLQDKKLKNGTITQEQYDKNVQKIQEKAAKREKAYAVAAAIINTAQGISKALASSPPPLSFVLAGLVGALGAAQIATILSTQVGSKTPPQLGSTATGTGTETNTGTAPNTSFSFSEPIDQFPKKPTKSFVISKDVQTQSELDRRLIANGTII